MTRFNTRTFVAASIAVFLASCAQPVSWENDIHIPILDDQITWADVVPDSLYEPGQEGGPAHFVLQDTLDGWDWSEWVTLPDSTIHIRYDGAEQLQNGLVVFEDIDVVGFSDEITFNISEADGVALTEAKLSAGQLIIEVTHSLGGEVLMWYELPSVTIGGEPISFPLTMDAASGLEPGTASATLDLTGAELDLSGISGQETNALQVDVSATSGSIDNGQGFYLITATDSIVVNLSFQGMTLERLGGYFGQREERGEAQVDLLDTIPLPEPMIDLEGTQATLHFTNTIGADFRLFVDTLAFDDNLVTGDLIAGHDIPRAVWEGDVPQPSEWSLDLASPGSNFLELLEGFPSSLDFAGRMQLNPVNTSEWLLDEWDVNYLPTFWYELRVPLKLGINGIMLEDTFQLNALEDYPQFEGFLHLDFTNTFPLEVEGTMEFSRLDGEVILDTLVLPAGSVPLGHDGKGTWSIALNREMVTTGGQIAIALSINTNGPQPFTGYESVRVQARLEGTQRIETGEL